MRKNATKNIYNEENAKKIFMTRKNAIKNIYDEEKCNKKNNCDEEKYVKK